MLSNLGCSSVLITSNENKYRPNNLYNRVLYCYFLIFYIEFDSISDNKYGVYLEKDDAQYDY